jgi:hypothetical protein
MNEPCLIDSLLSYIDESNEDYSGADEFESAQFWAEHCNCKECERD